MGSLSTVAFAQLTAARQETDPAAPPAEKKPGTSKYVDVLAAIIPAEVIAAHALIVTEATQVKKVDIDPDPKKENLQQVTDVTDPTALKIAFFGLIFASLILYVATKAVSGASWRRFDYLRMSLPPIAFVAWTLLTEPSAFDGFNQGDLSDTTQLTVGVIVAVVLGAVANLCQKRADADSPGR